MGESLISCGTTTCEGCGMELIARTMMEVLGPDTIVVTPPSCSAILTGYGLETCWRIPAFQSNLENVAAYCSGIRVGLEVSGKEHVQVVGFAGDGGTVDIGLQSLSGAIERGHRFIYICYDNEAYMNTGIQRSGATPVGAWTTTTPEGKSELKKDIVGMLMAQGLPYLATASVGYIDDLKRKLKTAKSVQGPAYLHVLSPCATGWRFPARDTIRVARLAVDTNLWPLFEVTNGKVRLTRRINSPKSISEYLSAQGRFKNITQKQISVLQAGADAYYKNLVLKEEQQS